MSGHNLAEALRKAVAELQGAGLKAPCYCVASKHWSDCSFSVRAKVFEECREALAAHEAEQQAGEAVARVRVTSVTPGSFDEIDVLRPLPRGEYLLFTHPQQPLTDEQIRLERKRIDPMAEDMDAWSFEQGVRFAERALGITKDTKS